MSQDKLKEALDRADSLGAKSGDHFTTTAHAWEQLREEILKCLTKP